jgi:predicted RNA-binding Zn ribbon-like protein
VASEDGTRDSGFRFGNGRLCFTFTATLGDRGVSVPLERLAVPDDLARWCVEAGLLDEAPPAGPATLAGARRLREAIDRAAEQVRTGGSPGAQDVEVLNEWAARPSLAPQLDGAGGLGWRQEGAQVRHVLALVARDAVDVLTGPMRSRLRRCANPDCEGLFVDVSRPGNRRWCSMSTCGNQAKKAAYRQRHPQSG